MKRKLIELSEGVLLMASMVIGTFLAYEFFQGFISIGNPFIFLVVLWFPLATGGVLFLILVGFAISIGEGRIEEYISLVKSLFH